MIGTDQSTLIALQIAATRFRPALYWGTVIASTTAGTTLADFATRSLGIGYPGGSLLLWLEPGEPCGFWAAFILTRPLGATVGDFLGKPVGQGGLEFSRPLASLVLIVAIAVLIWLVPQRAGAKAEVAAV